LHTIMHALQYTLFTAIHFGRADAGLGPPKENDGV